MSGHWAEAWLGQPWVAGTSDCWSFARRVWAERFGRQVEPLPVDPSDFRAAVRALDGAKAGGWIATAAPVEGDGVLMAEGQRPCHVGIWLAPAHVLHSVEGAGVICTPAARLPQLGYRIAAYLRREDW
jgi:cell wall-associated NlpC family hydrolase